MNTKTLLIIGGVLVAGAAAYYFFIKKDKLNINTTKPNKDTPAPTNRLQGETKIQGQSLSI